MAGSSPKSLRLFFALWPDEPGRKALAAWQKPLHQQCGGRVMRAEGLHATLVFLGNVPADRLHAAEQAAQAVSGTWFELVWEMAQCWRHNHIVFAAPVQTPQPLQQLVAALEQALAQQGFAFDRRAYQAHVTLLRNARCPAEAMPVMSPVIWQARDFALVQSVPGESGGHYQMLSRFPLMPT